MPTQPIFFNDARNAIRDANMLATVLGVPRGVAYVQPHGWVHYDPRDGVPLGGEPEFLCFALGKLPLPLSPMGIEVWQSILHAAHAPLLPRDPR